MPQATLSLPIHDETARNTFKHRHDTGPPEGMLARFQNHNNVPTARCEPRSGRTYPQCWKRRRCGGYWRGRRAWPQCWWAAAGPGRASRRRAERRSRRGRRAGGPPPSGAESSWGGGPPPSGTEKGHQHCAVTIGNGDPTHQQHGHQCPHERSSHVHNAEACITNLFHVINFQCIHSYDI